MLFFWANSSIILSDASTEQGGFDYLPSYVTRSCKNNVIDLMI